METGTTTGNRYQISFPSFLAVSFASRGSLYAVMSILSARRGPSKWPPPREDSPANNSGPVVMAGPCLLMDAGDESERPFVTEYHFARPHSFLCFASVIAVEIERIALIIVPFHGRVLFSSPGIPGLRDADARNFILAIDYGLKERPGLLFNFSESRAEYISDARRE